MKAITDIPFKQALQERYLSYALSTIMSRSLPDVRDGLKPVHRRLIYGMYVLRLMPQSGFKKCARIVGDVLGKFHPHGDVAIYDALVRLAQDFSVRYPLIEGQGNFGSLDGDNAAAMRYTEARLTKIAHLLLEGIEENCVRFKETYDGSEEEPFVLPSNFPNLLANGSAGIAVGMATSIPPHNLTELMDALINLIDKPDISVKELMEHVQGPDFPTGGYIVDSKESLLHTYETGKGSITIRAKWVKESLPHNQYRIIVEEIPYQTTKSKIIERIAQLLDEKKLPLLNDVFDESDEKLRIVLEPKNRQVNAEALMETIFKQTDLEIKFHLNMNVLDKTLTPYVMSLKGVLQSFLDHRKEVFVARTNHRLEQIIHRLEIVKGLLVCYLNLDKVIAIIRESDDPKAELQETFNLTEVQCEAILNMRLRSLRKLQEIELKTEHDALEKEQAELSTLLSKESLQWKAIKKDFLRIKKEFGDERRTHFTTKPDIVIEELLSTVEKEDVTVIYSKQGWVRAIKGHATNFEDIKYKEGDEKGFIIKTNTIQKLILFATNGRFYCLSVDKLPRGRGFGDPIRMHIDLDNQDEILYVGATGDEKTHFLLADNTAKGFCVAQNDVVAQTRTGKQIFNMDGNDSSDPLKSRAVACVPISANDTHLALISGSRKLLVIQLNEVPILQKGKGVMLQKYKAGDAKEYLSDWQVFNLEEGLRYRKQDQIMLEKNIDGWLGRRGSVGKLAPIRFPRTNRFDVD